MATAELMPPQEEYPMYREGLGTGRNILMNPGATQATDEQNMRVKMILDALRMGVSPESQGVPNASGLAPVQPGGVPQATQPFGLSGYQGSPPGVEPPADNKARLLDLLRSNPDDTMRAMRETALKLKGTPDRMQGAAYEAMGLPGMGPGSHTDNQPRFDAGTVNFAATGGQVPGLTQQQAQAMQANTRAQANLGEVERAKIAREQLDLKPLTPEQMSKLFKYDPVTRRAIPYAGPVITHKEARAQGLKTVNPKAVLDAQSGADAINQQYILLKGAIESASDKTWWDLQKSVATGGTLGGMEGKNLNAALTDFAVFWEKQLGGVRMVASPNMLEAMKVRLPQLWDEDVVRKQKMKLLQPAVIALQTEKLNALMGLPRDPRITKAVYDALLGMKTISPGPKGPGLTTEMIRQFVYESGDVPDAAPESPRSESGLPVTPRPENTVEFGGIPYVVEGPGRFRPLDPNRTFNFETGQPNPVGPPPAQGRGGLPPTRNPYKDPNRR